MTGAPGLVLAVGLIERAADEPEALLRRQALRYAAELVERDATPAAAVVQVEAGVLRGLVRNAALALLIADPDTADWGPVWP